MGFEKFGKVNFVGQTKVGDFIKFLEDGKIAGTKCKKCGKMHFPPRVDCDSCLSSEVEWVPLSGKCKLITYTVVYFAPPRFRYDCPYTLAVAQFAEGPRVFAPLSKEVKQEEIKIGMPLKLEVTKLIGDKIIYELRK
jgi:uncharacterized OB-fold protein